MAMTVRLKSSAKACDRTGVSDWADQQFLWQMCQAVSKEHCPCDLALRKPGLMYHSRWLTTANRILRLYVGLDTPSNNIKTLVTFIIHFYALTWFAIKTQPSCIDGAEHLHGMMVITQYLSSSRKKIIDPVIQRNGSCGHPENVLLTMITDERPHIRELGLRRIMKARPHVSANKIHRFQVPPLNLNATEYHGIVDWQTLTVTEPPVMVDMTTNWRTLFLLKFHHDSSSLVSLVIRRQRKDVWS